MINRSNVIFYAEGSARFEELLDAGFDESTVVGEIDALGLSLFHINNLLDGMDIDELKIMCIQMVGFKPNEERREDAAYMDVYNSFYYDAPFHIWQRTAGHIFMSKMAEGLDGNIANSEG